MSLIQFVRRFSYFKKNKPISLGRWNLDYKNNDLKIAYANHDSCGGELCAQPICAEIINNSKKTNINYVTDEDIYLYSMIGSFHIDPKK